MNIRVAIILPLVLFILSINAQGIQFFEGTWKEAMAKAKAEDKLLFVDAFAKWCGPCKAMAKNVFTQPSVGEFFNTNFINLKLDMEEADGVTFGHKYPVSAYPTLFFIDGEGKVVKNIKGGQQPDGLIALGEDAMKKVDKSVRYEEKYKAGDRSYDLMYNYVKALNAAGKPSLKISNEYLSSNPEMTEEQKLKYVLEAAVDADTKLFDQVVANKTKIENLVGKDVYAEKCKSACYATIKKAIEFEMESMFLETIQKAKKTFPDDADEFAANAEMQYYKAFQNNDKYIKAYQTLAKKVSKDPAKLKNIVNDIIRSNKDNQKMIADAAEFSGQVYELKEDMESLNQYCSVLVLSKQVDKAIKVVKKAREKAEKDGGDLASYDGLLNFLNSKKI
ncbi:MAG: thioredoxin family protein [Saprospiraceae bacterium]|nr:thioredoxin family protein [Saprospiraceae bacterium]